MTTDKEVKKEHEILKTVSYCCLTCGRKFDYSDGESPEEKAEKHRQFYST